MASLGTKSPPKPTPKVQTPSSPTGKPMKSSLSMDTGKEMTAATTITAAANVSTRVGGGGRAHMPLSATASLNTTGGTVSGSQSARPGPTPTPLPRTKRLSKRANVDSKMTPRRNFSKINRKGSQIMTELHRPCLQHSFITEVTDVQQMEQGLLQLLDDFHSGKLQAFGKDCSFQKMDNVREQQERLARLHFELGSQQEAYGTLSEEGQAVAKDSLAKLMAQLQELSMAIEQLQSSTTSNSDLQTEV